MKTKAIFFVSLIFQIAFLFFVLRIAPEPHGGFQAGLERLKENCPTQMPTIENASGGLLKLETAGDFFYIADHEFQFFIKATLLFVCFNLVIWLLMFEILRKSQAVKG
jgi:hypothetical protein